MYKVRWEIDVEASDEVEAARRALEIQKGVLSIATVFDVNGVVVDCLEILRGDVAQVKAILADKGWTGKGDEECTFDDLVADRADEDGSRVNNDGIDSQIGFLIEKMGFRGLMDWVEREMG